MMKDQTSAIVLELNEWLLARVNAYKIIDQALFTGAINNAVHSALKSTIDSRDCKTLDEYMAYLSLPLTDPIEVPKRRMNDNARKAIPYKKFIQSETLTPAELEEFKNTIRIQFGDEAHSVEVQAYMDRGKYLEHSTISMMKDAFPGIKEDQSLQRFYVRIQPLKILPYVHTEELADKHTDAPVDKPINTQGQHIEYPVAPPANIHLVERGKTVTQLIGYEDGVVRDLNHAKHLYELTTDNKGAFCVINGRFDAVRGKTVFEIKNRISDFHIHPRERLQLCIYIMMGDFTEGYLVERCNNQLKYTLVSRDEARTEWNSFAEALYNTCSDIYQNPERLPSTLQIAC